MSRNLILISLLISFAVGIFAYTRKSADGFTVLLVPHNHIFQPKIMEFMDRQYHPNIKNIIILGTNHADAGPVILKSDDDYSIQNIVPVVKKMYPTANIMPYIFRPGHDLLQTLSFSEDIKKIYHPDNTVIIASVDFSHYTSLSQADVFDQETITALRNRDYNQLITWGPEHTDCPDCLIVSSNLGDSFSLTGREYLDGTSYIFGIFR
ncbi:MAG: AmmeMemoRadiSam system protein B [Candidatus Shapirobacteria bacterium]|jgi:predicted class III extradiol MEMO1 family dioxygenase